MKHQQEPLQSASVRHGRPNQNPQRGTNRDLFRNQNPLEQTTNVAECEAQVVPMTC